MASNGSSKYNREEVDEENDDHVTKPQRKNVVNTGPELVAGELEMEEVNDTKSELKVILYNIKIQLG